MVNRYSKYDIINFTPTESDLGTFINEDDCLAMDDFLRENQGSSNQKIVVVIR